MAGYTLLVAAGGSRSALRPWQMAAPIAVPPRYGVGMANSTCQWPCSHSTLVMLPKRAASTCSAIWVMGKALAWGMGFKSVRRCASWAALWGSM